MKKLLFISTFIFVLGFSSCSSSSSDDENEPPVDNPTALIAAQNYYKDNLKTTITQHCTSCHENYHNKQDNSNYESFRVARLSATSMFNQVNSGDMPKGMTKLQQVHINKFNEFKNLVNAIN